jgi:hypothetical protein
VSGSAVGERTFGALVATPRPFGGLSRSEGGSDNIVVHHPSTQAWIDAVEGGGVINDARWAAGSKDIVFNRRIIEISGNTIELDAPVFNHLDRKLSQSYVAKTSARYASQVAVENLRIDIQTAGGEDENHAWIGLQFVGAYDSWARGVTVLHFGYAGISMNGAVRVTVEGSRSLDPVAVRTGGRMYNFSMERNAQLVLIAQCEARNGRHGLINDGLTSASGIVFHRCNLTNGGGNEGGHRMWTQGVLFDNVVELESNSTQILLINRGDAGTSHGWGTAHSVIWDFNQEIVVQKPPTGQNYAISPRGRKRPSAYAPGPDGFLEIKGPNLVPRSLYEAQLCDRLRR